MDIIKKIEACFDRGGKLLVAGNGGSAAESAHLAAEFVGIGYPAIAFSDPSVITALSNDFGYEEAVVLWLTALMKPEDLFIGISSSGKSKNINNALIYAGQIGQAIDFPRKGTTTSEVQNKQLELIHKIYEAFK